jgi:hypothetical protein
MQTCNATGNDITPGFYVTAIDGQRMAYVSGPFETHEQALDQVEPARTLWSERDARAWFAAWGTARVKK